jgi:hypothetical protein
LGIAKVGKADNVRAAKLLSIIGVTKWPMATQIL